MLKISIIIDKEMNWLHNKINIKNIGGLKSWRLKNYY